MFEIEEEKKEIATHILFLMGKRPQPYVFYMLKKKGKKKEGLLISKKRRLEDLEER